MQISRLTVATALTRVAESIDARRTLEGTLDVVVEAARAALPEFAHVSVSVKHRDGTFETKAGTDQLAWQLDAVQYDLGEGPCLHAIEHDPVVVAERLRHEPRWPRYIQAAVAQGVRSQVGVRLFSNRKQVGGLNLYSTERDEVDDECTETARLVARHTALMLRRAEHEHQLSQALQTRKMIGQAIGILMERYRIDQQRAFEFLVRTSSTGNIKLREVAKELVTSSNERYRTDS